ncbi:MAG TPA: tRNA threonylcarbamoyladenosine dehydratase [Bacteroidales bacterium]|nr:tRNA threonylcarbamoyladenosine dehydratase [Bacteroidales bacterium]
MEITEDWLSRTRLLLSDEQINTLKNAHVLVVGLGGVGAYAAELICRTGVGKMTIVDGDSVHPSNRNRQLLALTSTNGQSKALLMKERLNDINPEAEIHAVNEFIRDDQMIELLNTPFDYVVDAIDTLSPKLYLIFHAVKKNLRIVSSMGSGGKLDPTGVRIDDISKSYNCKLAYVLRKRLRKLGISKGIKVIYSIEQVSKDSVIPCEDEMNKKSIVGTISFMPPLFGCFIASVVINDLIKAPNSEQSE